MFAGRKVVLAGEPLALPAAELERQVLAAADRFGTGIGPLEPDRPVR